MDTAGMAPSGPVDEQPALPGMEDTGVGCNHPSSVPCIACDSGPCPVCAKPSFWRRMFGRHMHADGSDNAKCWAQLP